MYIKNIILKYNTISKTTAHINIFLPKTIQHFINNQKQKQNI